MPATASGAGGVWIDRKSIGFLTQSCTVRMAELFSGATVTSTVRNQLIRNWILRRLLFNTRAWLTHQRESLELWVGQEGRDWPLGGTLVARGIQGRGRTGLEISQIQNNVLRRGHPCWCTVVTK